MLEQTDIWADGEIGYHGSLLSFSSGFKSQLACHLKMKSFTKTTTFEPIWCVKEFSVYSKEFRRIRSRMKYKSNRCFKCEKEFALEEPIGLVCLKDIGNKTICQKCLDDILL